MTAQTRVASTLFAILPLCAFLLAVTIPVAAKDDWQADLHRWVVSNDTNPNCKVRYMTGMYRPSLGDQPAWGMMTEKMFKWFSTDGVKLAPALCPASRNTKDKVSYRILFSVSPMKTVSRTTHGSELHTVNEPFSANVNSRTADSDGSTANTTATINGQQTTTEVVPTETTVSQSSVSVYMYTYRVNGNQLALIASDTVLFSRVGATGSGEDAAGAELGAGIGNLIRASGDRHRSDKLYEEALKAIRTDAIAAPAAESTRVKAATDIQPTPPTQSVQQQAARGDAKAEGTLGAMYARGAGVSLDNATAALWWRKSADQGNADSQYALGGLYRSGIGVPQDYAEAYFWLELAAATVSGLNSEDTARARDEAASHLTPADLSRVQERATKWFEDHPTKPQ